MKKIKNWWVNENKKLIVLTLLNSIAQFYSSLLFKFNLNFYYYNIWNVLIFVNHNNYIPCQHE